MDVWIAEFAYMWAYGMGPLLSFCMTINRLIAVFFPLNFKNYKGRKLKFIVLFLCCLITVPMFLYGSIASMFSTETDNI